MELHNMDPDVLDELYKIASINLSPNTPGQVSKVMKPDFDTVSITHKSQCHMMSLDSQISLGLMVNPPKQGDASYVQFMKEKDGLLNSLKRRARKMTDAFNALEGVSCQETEGDIWCYFVIRLHVRIPSLNFVPSYSTKSNLVPNFYLHRRHVLLPKDHHPPCRHCGRKSKRKGTRCDVLPRAPRRDWYVIFVVQPVLLLRACPKE